MKELTPQMMGWIVLVTQIIFLYLRTLNVKAVAGGDEWKSIWTGWGIYITWTIGIAIGANAMMEGSWFPIFMGLLGGTIGTWWAMRVSKKKEKAKSKLSIDMGKVYRVTYPTNRTTLLACNSELNQKTLVGYRDDPKYKVEEIKQ